MAIPDFQSVMRPLLELAADGNEHSLSTARESLANKFSLTEEEKKALLPSGKQPTFTNRVALGKVYLSQAGALNSPRRGYFRITERGRELLERVSGRITIRELKRYPEFVEFRGPTKPETDTSAAEVKDAEEHTPEERLEAAYQTIRSRLAAELLMCVKGASPEFFEHLVVELLLKMGYGGSRGEAGEVIGRAGDEGIDGIISQDRLGLDVIYLQAKRWEAVVGRPEIQKFVGALHGKRARKGVFITTSDFSADAREYVENIDPKVVLITGTDLASYMIDFGVGVARDNVYETKKIDSDYFVEE